MAFSITNKYLGAQVLYALHWRILSSVTFKGEEGETFGWGRELYEKSMENEIYT